MSRVRSWVGIVAASLLLFGCESDEESRRNGDTGVDTDVSDTEVDTDVSDTEADTDSVDADSDVDPADVAWASAQEAALASRATYEALTDGDAIETCLWQQWRSAFGFGWASRSSFVDEGLQSWEYCEITTSNPDEAGEYTCERGEANESPTFEHVAARAFDAMSELYAYCIEDLLQRDRSVWTSPVFEADESGVLSRCGVTQQGCADDCTDGVVVLQFELASCDFETPIDG